jgi:hypothetical protein
MKRGFWWWIQEGLGYLMWREERLCGRYGVLPSVEP